MRQFTRYLSNMYTYVSGLSDETRLDELHAGPWRPLVDIYECDRCVKILAELPGVDQEKLEVAVEGGVLKISGTRPKRLPEDTHHVHQMEIPYGFFSRVVKLPDNYDVDHIEAEYEDGYLVVTIPRSK